MNIARRRLAVGAGILAVVGSVAMAVRRDRNC